MAFVADKYKQGLQKKFMPKKDSHPMMKVINAASSNEIHHQMVKMHSQQDAMSGEHSQNNTLVFIRQVYTPELFFNQDTNREEKYLDKASPYNWHVN